MFYKTNILIGGVKSIHIFVVTLLHILTNFTIYKIVSHTTFPSFVSFGLCSLDFLIKIRIPSTMLI